MTLITVPELYSGDLQIRTYPDEILKTVADSFEEGEFGVELALLGQKMIHAMIRYNGAGLAAPQVGIAKRIFVMRLNDDTIEPLVLVNPVILEKSQDGFFAEEGCLSLPGVSEQVYRSREVWLGYQTVYGEARQVVVFDFEARIVQHEMDHLNGKMFFERMSRQLRRGVLARWKKSASRSRVNK